MGRVTTPWQENAAEKIVQLLNSEHDEYLILNCPPGSGKSTLMTDTCTWALVRDRTTRVLYGSASQSVASDYTRRIMNDLAREETTRASAKNLSRGLEIDGQATLTADYGPFKPANGDRWTKEKFVIRQQAGKTAQEKEASVAAFGMDSTFLGGRYDLNMWDDLVTDKTLRTEEARERLINFWETYAESRVEPGGLIVLCGQRLSGDDLYRYALDMVGGDEWTDLEDHIGGEPDEAQSRKYHHVVYPAHDVTICAGPTVLDKKGNAVPNPQHKLDAPAWPKGCLLDPKRLAWRKLATIKANKADRFEVVYQQKDTDPSTALVKHIWIDGGVDLDGVQYVGCRSDRGVAEVPKHLGPAWSVISVDPSPTKFWSIGWWLYDQTADRWYLMDLHRARMTAPEWLDWNTTTGEFTGIAEEWQQRAQELGRPITDVIVEVNAAQKFMHQYDYSKNWQRTRSINIREHSTNKNKSDSEYGVQMLGPLYQFGKVDLPAGTYQSRIMITPLVKELTQWPHGTTDDCVMSMWFAVFTASKVYAPQGTVYQFKRPTWLRTA
jgi:hypothetical protein